MSPDLKRARAALDIFEQVVELDPDRCRLFLDRVCAGDEVLRREVESLLDSEAVAGTFLEKPALDASTIDPEPSDSYVGQHIGRYHIRSVIAEGGMGVVYSAVQEQPHRTVALKVMKRGIASRQALRRFQYEAQVLSRLSHPAIAQIYEAGMHGDGTGGVPYFAMEYIPGACMITDYARRQSLDKKARIALFLQICAGVDHGHQKGIIHRDLKPGNLLIDSSGRVKIIDFGVARATDADLAITTLQTDIGQLIGTLPYMSPEQCRADPHDLDTRSDVYSLGVVLYELLTGQLPYKLADTPIPEIIRIIQDTPPIRPSTIDRTVRGDLETIILKALAKERDRRYESVAALASDIKRYLQYEPIEARPPSAIYQMRKYCRRHRVAVGSGVIITALLVTGIISTSWGLAEAVRERDRAFDAEAKATRELMRANAVVALIDDMFSSADPHERKGPNYTVRQLLDDFEGTIGDQFEGQPLVEASIRHTVGNAYLGLGLPDEAEGHLQDALDLRTQELGEHDPLAYRTRHSLVSAHHDRGEYAEAERKIRVLLEQVADVEDLDSLQQSLTHSLADLLRHQGRYDEAEPLFVKGLETHKRNLGDEHPRTLISMNNLAILYRHQGRYDEAEPLHLKTLEIQQRVLGDEHPGTLISMNNLAVLYGLQHRYDEAEPLFAKTLETHNRILGDEHPSALSSMNNLAMLYRTQGRYDEAEPLFLKTLEIRQRVLGDEHPDTLRTMFNLAGLCTGQGRYDEAEPLFLKTLEIQKRVLGDEHPDMLGTMSNLALLYWNQGRYEKAESLYLQALDAQKRVLGDEHPDTLGSITNLGLLYLSMKRFDDAQAMFERSLPIKRRVLGMGHPWTRNAMQGLAQAYDGLGRSDEAEPLYLETLNIEKRVLGEEHPDTLMSMNSLANMYDDQGRYDEAEPLYLTALEIKKRILGDEHPGTLITMNNLALLYGHQGRYDEAEPLNLKTLEIRKRVLGDEHRVTLGSITNLGLLYLSMKRYDDARAMFERSLPIKRRVLGMGHPWTRHALRGLARAYDGLEQNDDALPLWRELHEFQLAQAEDPDASAQMLNAAAWDLLTNEHEALRDPARALPLAQRAVDKVGGNNPAILDTLALAQHLTGDTAAAIETQRRAVELQPNDEGLAETLARYEAALQPDKTERESDADKDN